MQIQLLLGNWELLTARGRACVRACVCVGGVIGSNIRCAGTEVHPHQLTTCLEVPPKCVKFCQMNLPFTCLSLFSALPCACACVHVASSAVRVAVLCVRPSRHHEQQGDGFHGDRSVRHDSSILHLVSGLCMKRHSLSHSHFCTLPPVVCQN